MKILITLYSMLFLCACGNLNLDKSHAKAIEKPENNIKKASTTGTTNRLKKIDWTTFDEVFKYEIEEEEFIQILGLNELDTDSIDYQFYLSSMLCESEFSGKAKIIRNNNHQNESDSINEYFFEGKSYSILIKVGAESRSTARIIYKHDGEIDDCDPYEQTVMTNTRTTNKTQ